MPITIYSQSLPQPQPLYPTDVLHNRPPAPTNQVTLAAGHPLMVPGGRWLVSGGAVSALQFRDPVSRQWVNLSTPGAPWAMQIAADGFNYRVANLSGVATGATVSAAGNDYLQETTRVHPSAGNSRWHLVVGGAVGTINIRERGANYTVPPDVFISTPPTPGLAAAASASLASDGTISDITVTQPGGGYIAAPQILLIPSPADANVDIGRIKNATATASLVGEGTVTAVLLESFGAPLDAAPSLNIVGQGSGATATVLPAAWIAPIDDLVLMQPAGIL